VTQAEEREACKTQAEARACMTQAEAREEEKAELPKPKQRRGQIGSDLPLKVWFLYVVQVDTFWFVVKVGCEAGGREGDT